MLGKMSPKNPVLKLFLTDTATTIHNLAATAMAFLVLAGTTAATANARGDADTNIAARDVAYQACLGPFFANGGKPTVKNIQDCGGQYKKRDVVEGKDQEEDDDDAASYIIDGGQENTIVT
ncbi:hypothetical protein BU16DRAFT_533648 [Lophium mytilinum]|uniref:Uncharacterized protein n=1 Tax=Lophium mytilinum TaxID=390894 RepID=A0A6A6R8V1_9PEZI|nr:hypothetical protein BU16DRAFT_533648 [Lophium mytilinum]